MGCSQEEEVVSRQAVAVVSRQKKEERHLHLKLSFQLKHSSGWAARNGVPGGARAFPVHIYI